MTKFLCVAAILAIGVIAAVWYIRRPEPLIQPGSLNFPVLLLNEDKISEVCLNVDELTTRPEDQEYSIEESFRVVDAHGASYRIENYRVVEKKPSTLSRIFNASIYSQMRFKAAFDLRPDGKLTRDEIIRIVNDIPWSGPAAPSPPSLADLYVAYRKYWSLMRAHSSVREQENTPEQEQEEEAPPE